MRSPVRQFDPGQPEQIIEIAGPSDGKRGQIPGRKGFFQTMIGMVCVREDLFNGLGSKESAYHRTASGHGAGERRCRVNELLFHMGSSIAGSLRRIAE